MLCKVVNDKRNVQFISVLLTVDVKNADGNCTSTNQPAQCIAVVENKHNETR